MESFRTKRGRCVVTDDELRIERSLRLHLLRYWEGNKVLLAVYLAAYAGLAYAAARVVRGGNWRALAVGALAVVAVVAVGRVLNSRRGVTGDDSIPLHDVEAVVAVAGDDWFTRPRFVVRYWRGDGVKHRHVMMPSGLLSFGDREFERAVDLFRQAGVPVERADAADAAPA